jgi:hypothetical protein
MLKDQNLHGRRLEAARSQSLAKTKNVHSLSLCPSRTAGSFSHFKQSTKDIQLDLVPPNQHQITMLQKQLAFVLNNQNREPTGQCMRQCTHLSKKSILVPYLSEQKAKFGLPESQKSIWQIDVWSVH